MQEIIITPNEENQRLDKFLLKYLNDSNKSFVYKMLRKKNIKLNDKKAEGSEMLSSGDNVKLFLSDETIDKFTKVKRVDKLNDNVEVIYEDENIILVNKPQGLLSQPSEATEDCINNRILSYLYNKGEYDISKKSTFTPGISNRLDRNTSGIVICGKNLSGTQELNKLIVDNLIDKYYVAVVYGKIDKEITLTGYHTKGEENQVEITEVETEDSKPVITEIYPIETNDRYSYIKIKLVTGKSHQIRAHLNGIGHPIVGDKKYTIEDKKIYNTKYQMLHGGEIIFKSGGIKLSYLEGKSFVAEKPREFNRIYDKLFKKS